MTTMTGTDVDLFRDAVAAAVRAPSVYNAQPWRFALHDGRIDIRIDPYLLLPIADPDRWSARNWLCRRCFSPPPTTGWRHRCRRSPSNDRTPANNWAGRSAALIIRVGFGRDVGASLRRPVDTFIDGVVDRRVAPGR
jgi:hypothetical protein